MDVHVHVCSYGCVHVHVLLNVHVYVCCVGDVCVRASVRACVCVHTCLPALILCVPKCVCMAHLPMIHHMDTAWWIQGDE